LMENLSWNQSHGACFYIRV